MMEYVDCIAFRFLNFRIIFVSYYNTHTTLIEPGLSCLVCNSVSSDTLSWNGTLRYLYIIDFGYAYNEIQLVIYIIYIYVYAYNTITLRLKNYRLWSLVA